MKAKLSAWIRAHVWWSALLFLVLGGIFLAAPLAVWRARLKAKVQPAQPPAPAA